MGSGCQYVFELYNVPLSSSQVGLDVSVVKLYCIGAVINGLVKFT